MTARSIRLPSQPKTRSSKACDPLHLSARADVGPSRDGRYPGVIDGVASTLADRGAGDYVAFYASAGGEQRVAMMWDRDWVRAKDETRDLFARGAHRTPNGKDAFAGRTPLFGHFAARVPVPDEDHAGAYLGGPETFDFQAVGVHLKAMADGHEQRLVSAEVLARWLSLEATQRDADALIVGDWNAPPDDPCWAPFHELEARSGSPVKFREINDRSEFSYLWLANKSSRFVSRIDLTAMSLASETKPLGKAGAVILWKPIEAVIQEATAWTDKQVIDVLRWVKETISDHLPVVSRFYLTPPPSQQGEKVAAGKARPSRGK